jgi:hypothetical protein
LVISSATAEAAAQDPNWSGMPMELNLGFENFLAPAIILSNSSMFGVAEVPLTCPLLLLQFF